VHGAWTSKEYDEASNGGFVGYREMLKTVYLPCGGLSHHPSIYGPHLN
jgi:hypothetical protein